MTALEQKTEKVIRSGGGVYVYRTDKPNSVMARMPTRWWNFWVAAGVTALALHLSGGPVILALLIFLATGRHFAYVGETVNFKQRHGEHINGGGRFKKGAKPWTDLNPVCVLRIPLPKWKPMLRTVETLLMLALAPVYNDRKNKWNPRRIPLRWAHQQRSQRDARGWCVNITLAHVTVTLAGLAFALVLFN